MAKNIKQITNTVSGSSTVYQLIDSRVDDLQTQVDTNTADIAALLTGYNDGRGIVSIEKKSSTTTNPIVDTYEITYTDYLNPDTFTVTNGSKGDTGEDGNGISSIKKSGTSGLVDTYTITYSNGDTDTLTVTNGAAGDDGSDGSTYINVNSTDSGFKYAAELVIEAGGFKIGDFSISTDSGTIWVCKSASSFEAGAVIKGDKGDTGEQGEKGAKGDKGNSGDVSSVQLTSTDNIPTYLINGQPFQWVGKDTTSTEDNVPSNLYFGQCYIPRVCYTIKVLSSDSSIKETIKAINNYFYDVYLEEGTLFSSKFYANYSDDDDVWEFTDNDGTYLHFELTQDELIEHLDITCNLLTTDVILVEGYDVLNPYTGWDERFAMN